MISVIIPAYKTEPFIRKCLDSVCNQTYRDLDIILIDDGSPDRCGEIFDEYARKDTRIRVFHTENRSISCARNLGIEKARNAGSEYIAFVDSDDWLELEMYEKLHNLAEDTGAEIVACGVIHEYMKKSLFLPIPQKVYQADESYNSKALIALMNGGLREEVWNKLWKTELFQSVRFPAGWPYQDVATIYRVIEKTSLVACTNWVGYHYRFLKSGDSKQHDARHHTYEWLAHKQRYLYFRDQLSLLPNSNYDLIIQTQLKKCANVISRYWAWQITFSKEEKRKYAAYVKEMCAFSKEHFPNHEVLSWPIGMRIMIFLTHYTSPPVFLMAYILNQIRRLCKSRSYR